jgi:uncharacterized alpha/beta hydrolase family protein
MKILKEYPKTVA